MHFIKRKLSGHRLVAGLPLLAALFLSSCGQPERGVDMPAESVVTHKRLSGTKAQQEVAKAQLATAENSLTELRLQLREKDLALKEAQLKEEESRLTLGETQLALKTSQLAFAESLRKSQAEVEALRRQLAELNARLGQQSSSHETANNFASDITKSMSRPTMEKRENPAIFTANKFGASNIGPTAVDSRWSNYGQYLQQVIETVQVQWNRILTQSEVHPKSGTTVSVKFILYKTGEVTRIISADGTADDQAQRACVSAITSRATYGGWTDDMVNLLGNQQEMTFTFYYQ